MPTARPASASAITFGTDADAITARTPDHAAIFAAASLLAIPPLPAFGSGAAGRLLERFVDLDDLLDQRRVRVVARVGGEQAAGVGQQQQRLGVHEVRDERREPVVVAVADLVVGDGVVLVDDRQHAELAQPLQGLPRVEVLTAMREVVRREQHLTRDDAVRPEQRVHALEEQRLTHGRDRLQRSHVGRSAAAGRVPACRPRSRPT